MTQLSHFWEHIQRNPKHNLKEQKHPMFIAGLITIARIWKQPECPSVDEWIKLLLPGRKREENFTLCNSMDGPGEHSASQRKTNTI